LLVAVVALAALVKAVRLEDELSEGGALSDLAPYMESTKPAGDTQQAEKHDTTAAADGAHKPADDTQHAGPTTTTPPPPPPHVTADVTQKAETQKPAAAADAALDQSQQKAPQAEVKAQQEPQKAAKNNDPDTAAIDTASYKHLNKADSDMESVERGAAQIAIDSKKLEAEAFDDAMETKGAKKGKLGDAQHGEMQPLFNTLKKDASNLNLYAKETEAIHEASEIKPLSNEISGALDKTKKYGKEATRSTEQMAQQFQQLSQKVHLHDAAGVAQAANRLGAEAQDVVQAEASAEIQDQKLETADEDRLINVAN
jgi:hypothetical protein